jgi:orotate phosphoribosyltransferase
MIQTKRDFIKFCIDAQVLTFGDFVLKSSRKSPYFFNAGLFKTGRLMQKLTEFYADVIVQENVQYDVIFGPAYKGIPLVTGTCINLFSKYAIDSPYAFNRKEKKDHGEGGTIVGQKLQGKILVVDDVITAGTAIREAFDIIQGAGATLGMLCIN